MSKIIKHSKFNSYQQILSVVNLYMDHKCIMPIANRLSKMFKGRLSLLATIELKDLVSHDLELILDLNIAKTKELLKKIGFSYKIPSCDQYVRAGDTAIIIDNLAKELKFDLIILDEMTATVLYDSLRQVQFDTLIVHKGES